MTELESALREGLHDRLDQVGSDSVGDLGRGVPYRAARIRRRHAALVSVAAASVLLAGVGAAIAVPRWREAPATVRVTVDPSPTPTPGGSEVASRTEEYVRQFAAGDFESIREDMTTTARTALTVDRISTVWRSMVGSGSAVDIGPAQSSKTGDRRVGFAVAESRQYAGTVYVVFDDGKVSGLLMVASNRQGASQTDPSVRRAEQIVEQLASNDVAGARRDFDETMLAGLSEEQLSSTWAQVERTYGPWQSHGDHLVTVTRSGFRVVDVISYFYEGVMKVRVSFDDRRRVAGLYVLVLDA